MARLSKSWNARRESGCIFSLTLSEGWSGFPLRGPRPSSCSVRIRLLFAWLVEPGVIHHLWMVKEMNGDVVSSF
jgi:hypothetical protein